MLDRQGHKVWHTAHEKRTRMIKNIIFDVGKVLVEWDCDRAFEQLGITGAVKEAVADATVRSADWNEYDRSACPPEEQLAQFIRKIPQYENELRLFWDHIGLAISRYPYTLPWVRALKTAGYQVYILSNYAAWTYEQTKDELCFLEEVDGAVFSFQVQMVKPESAIYRALLGKYQLAPKESVFVDDRLDNIEAARREGLHAIHFISYAQAVCDLASLGVRTENGT